MYRCRVKAPQKYRYTMRPPANVPYIVDNLWEWKRPEQYPNRRYSAFASPTKELALASADENTIACRVSLSGNYNLCQLKGNQDFKNNEDSKNHKDCVNLRKLMFSRLGLLWVDSELHAKSDVGRLWMPCLRKEEVDSLFENTEVLREIRQEIYDAITYWDDIVLIRRGGAIPDQKGEIFFEVFDGYRLLPI